MTIIEHALRIAAVAHHTQTRKGTPVPYIVHPVMVSHTLIRHGFSDEVVAAGLVHDVLEDTEVTKTQLQEALGERVTQMVETLSEDKTLPWRERKEQYIENIRSASNEVKAISVADKIHNLTNLLDEYEKRGADVWNDFNAGREAKQWFEESMYEMLHTSFQHPLVEEYHVLVERLKALV